MDASGNLVEKYEYDPYGRTYISAPDGTARPVSAYGNPFAWTGQRYDPAVRLYHFWARSYSPALGRWLQRDPLGYVDGVGLYEYVGGDPVDLVDPEGLWYWPESCNPAPFNRWLGQKWFELFHGRNTVVTVTAGTGLGAGTTAVVASYKMPKNPAGDATMAAKAVRVGGAGLILLSGAAAALEIYETWDVAQGIVAPIQSGAGQWNGRVNDNGLRRVGAPQDLPDDYPGYPRKKK